MKEKLRDSGNRSFQLLTLSHHDWMIGSKKITTNWRFISDNAICSFLVCFETLADNCSSSLSCTPEKHLPSSSEMKEVVKLMSDSGTLSRLEQCELLTLVERAPGCDVRDRLVTMVNQLMAEKRELGMAILQGALRNREQQQNGPL